jgi:hypothetical protein
VRVMLTFAAALLCATTCRRFPTGGIEGTVRDRSGTPIGNVFVGVLGLAHSGRSDSSGRYRLTSVPVGTHRLRATIIGYAPLERDSVVVRQGGTTRVDFTLDRMSTVQETTAASQEWARLLRLSSVHVRCSATVPRARGSGRYQQPRRRSRRLHRR